MKTKSFFNAAVIIAITATSLQQANAQWNYDVSKTNVYNVNTGNVGIGTSSPTHSKLEIKGSVGATVAMFGSDKNGVALMADYPEIGFNLFYNNGQKTIKAGYASLIAMTPSTGDIYFGNFNGNKSTTDFGSISGYQQPLTIKQNGNIGIGTTTPAATLEVSTQSGATAIFAHTSAANGSGVIGYCSNGPSANGVEGVSSTGYAGYFSGNVHCTGVLTIASDQRLKENIKPIDKVLDKIMLLKPSTYNFKSEYIKMNLSRGEQIGFIAQDMEKVFPQLVKNIAHKDADNGEVSEYKGVNYLGLIPLLTRAIQDQQEEINELKQMIGKLTMQTVNINSSAELTKSNNVVISDATLEQNKPNPLTQSTSIRYNLPVGAKSAQLVVTDFTGKPIKQVALSSAGSGEINIDASALSTGTYTYSLFIDGKIITSRKMIVAK